MIFTLRFPEIVNTSHLILMFLVWKLYWPILYKTSLSVELHCHVYIARLEVLLINQRRAFVKHTTLIVKCKNKRKIMLINFQCWWVKNLMTLVQHLSFNNWSIAVAPNVGPSTTDQINARWLGYIFLESEDIMSYARHIISCARDNMSCARDDVVLTA